MRETNWLDDETDVGAMDPWGAQNPWSAPAQTPAPTPAPPTAAEAWMPTGAHGAMPNAPVAQPAAPAAPDYDYTSDLGPKSYDPGQVQAGADRGGVAGGTQAAETAPYRTELDAITSATDPQSKAVAQDALARRVQADLEADGHKVTWKGNVLMVDGRPYELGGAPVQSNGGYSGPTDVNSLIQHYQSNNPVGGGIDGLVRFLQQNGVNAKRATHSGMQSNDAIEINGQVYDEIFNVGGADQHWQHLEPGGGEDPLSALSGGRGGSWLDGPGASGFLGGFDRAYQLASQQSPLDAQMDAYVMDLLQHPESLSERDVETLRARSAEEAAVASQQQDEELQHFGYQAGLDSSPWLAGQRTQNDWNRRQATISSNRDVDIAAADRRGADRRAAAGVGQAWAGLKSSQKQASLSFAVSYLNQELGYDINLRQLSQQSEQFKATLMQRIAEYKQADDQFRARYGLDVQIFDHNKDQDMWERSRPPA